MGPEEIHIYFLEGAPRPPKRKCDRPKNLEVFLVNFQNRYLSNVVVFSLCGGEGWGWIYRNKSQLSPAQALRLDGKHFVKEVFCLQGSKSVK